MRRHSLTDNVPILCAMKKSLSELEMMQGDSVVMVGVGAKEGVDVGGHGVGPVYKMRGAKTTSSLI